MLKCKIKITATQNSVAQIVASWHPGCEKMKRNEKMKRKWRENEEMVRG